MAVSSFDWTSTVISIAIVENGKILENISQPPTITCRCNFTTDLLVLRLLSLRKLATIYNSSDEFYYHNIDSIIIIVCIALI